MTEQGLPLILLLLLLLVVVVVAIVDLPMGRLVSRKGYKQFLILPGRAHVIHTRGHCAGCCITLGFVLFLL